MSDLWMRGLTGYFLAINIIGFFLMWLDKHRAIKKKWRVRESTLFLIAILGGSIGSIIGMQLFRHKTKHMKFIIGMPFLLIMQVIVFAIYYKMNI